MEFQHGEDFMQNINGNNVSRVRIINGMYVYNLSGDLIRTYPEKASLSNANFLLYNDTIGFVDYPDSIEDNYFTLLPVNPNHKAVSINFRTAFSMDTITGFIFLGFANNHYYVSNNQNKYDTKEEKGKDIIYLITKDFKAISKYYLDFPYEDIAVVSEYRDWGAGATTFGNYFLYSSWRKQILLFRPTKTGGFIYKF